MTHRNAISAGLLSALVTGAALAQQTPTARVNVVAATNPAEVTVALRGVDAKPYVAVKAASSDVRTTLTDIATKAGAKLLLAPSATGTITGTVTSQPLDTALSSVAALAGLTVRKLSVPEAGASALTVETAGRYSEALSGLPVNATVTDPATGKSIVVQATAPTAATGLTAIYYVQGKQGPGQERGGGQFRRGGGPNGGGPGGPGGPGGGGQGNQPSQANQDFVNQTAQSLSKMPLQERMDTLRSLQRQMFQSLTPDEMSQLRQNGGGFGGRGGGGFGGRGGRGGGGFGGNQGGDPNAGQ